MCLPGELHRKLYLQNTAIKNWLNISKNWTWIFVKKKEKKEERILKINERKKCNKQPCKN
jgi:hypothetical protein